MQSPARCCLRQCRDIPGRRQRSPTLELGQAAINYQFRSCHIRAIRAREEQGGTRYLICFAEPLEWHLTSTPDAKASRHQSFALAAQELNVTPAAVGQLVRRLEEGLGVELFHRSQAGPARLMLTEAVEKKPPAPMENCRHA